MFNFYKALEGLLAWIFWMPLVLAKILFFPFENVTKLIFAPSFKPISKSFNFIADTWTTFRPKRFIVLLNPSFSIHIAWNLNDLTVVDGMWLLVVETK